MPSQRTARNKTIDMSILAKKNESTRAVGNMNVNARGDLIDSNNKVVQDRNSRVASNYSKTVNPPGTKPFKTAPVPTIKADLSKEEQAQFNEFDNPEPVVEPVIPQGTKSK
jgi:hypothetical protein